MSELSIEPYSDRSFAVRGDSKAIKDEMTKHCSWNSNLRGGPGWICSNSKEAIVKDIIDRHNRNVVPTSTDVKMTAKEFVELGDFEILNFLRDQVENDNIHRQRHRALLKFRDEGKLEPLLVILANNKTFEYFYTLSDDELIDEMKKNRTPYIAGLNHFSAAVIEAYYGDISISENVVALVNQFVPTFSVSLFNLGGQKID